MTIAGDTAKKIIPDNQLRFSLPSIRAGNVSFTFPVGPEGFTRSGSSSLGIHKFIGDNVVDVNVIHFDEGHIELNGTLPGLSSPAYMADLITVLTNRNKKVLRVPGVFPREQYVETENYNFNHPQDDRTHSIEYSVSFIRTGAGEGSGGFLEASLATLQSKASSPPNKKSVQSSGSTRSLLKSVGQQSVTGSPSTVALQSVSRPSTSRSARYFQVVDGVDTFRTISNYVYGDPDQTAVLIMLNQDLIQHNNPDLATVNSYQLIYYRWPRGTRVAY